jgi:hypothetical protein
MPRVKTDLHQIYQCTSKHQIRYLLVQTPYILLEHSNYNILTNILNYSLINCLLLIIACKGNFINSWGHIGPNATLPFLLMVLQTDSQFYAEKAWINPGLSNGRALLECERIEGLGENFNNVSLPTPYYLRRWGIEVQAKTRSKLIPRAR